MPALISALQPIIVAGSLMLASTHAASADDPVPSFNIEPSCRAAAAAAVSNNRDENSCKNDENTARAQLEKEWGQYSAAQRGHCVRLSSLGGSPSYVELLTCLELAKSASELPATTLGRGGRIDR